MAERERAELERVYQELEDARRIQQSFLPKGPPRIEGFEISNSYRPAREVSGDFYDYLALGKDTGIVLADVTGKSVKAAMVAAMTDGMLRAELEDREDIWNSPGAILKKLNMGLEPRLVPMMFAAVSLGILKTEEKRLILANAGMPYPIIKRGNKVWELEVNGMPVGITDGVEYNELRADLELGDFVIFYSDGVIEATNESDEMYQTERLLEVLKQADPGISAQDMVDLLVRDITAFMEDAAQSDDITIVVLWCKE